MINTIYTFFKAIKRVICDPKLIDEMPDDEKNIVFETYEGKIGHSEFVLKHDNYSPSEALQAVFPEGMEGKEINFGTSN